MRGGGAGARIVRLLGGLAVLLVGDLLVWPVRIDPVVWSPPPDSTFSGRFARNNTLAHGGRLLEGVGSGPEDVARGPDGLLYTGLDDGRMDVALKRERRLRWRATRGSRTIFPRGDWHFRPNLLPVFTKDRSNAVSTLRQFFLAPGASFGGRDVGAVPGTACATCGR